MIKIIVPIKRLSSLDAYVEAGADEVYGGLVDPSWQSEYGQFMEYNRRGSYGIRANVESEKEFYALTETCAKRQIPFYLTCNALKISDKQRELLRIILKKYRDAGGFGVIFSDLSVLEDVLAYDLVPVVSSCAEVTTRYLADFYKKMGCKRIILPRDITLKEIKSLSQKVSGIEYEIFFMNSGCRFTDGNCLGVHGTSERALCEYCDEHPLAFYRKDELPLSVEEQKILMQNQEDFRRLWSGTCANCNLYDIKEDVQSLKIVERVASEEKILRQIRIARKNVDLALQCTSRREYLEKMAYPKERKTFCLDFMNCYYRTDQIEEQKEMQKLEEDYQQFLDRFEQKDLQKKTEYIGVNLSAGDSGLRVDYKLYFNTKASLQEHHPIVDALQEKGMLRAVTRIHDTMYGKSERFDLGLAKRTKENMDYFYQVMADYTPLMKEHLSEIRRLNEMKISEKPEDASAALYFFGFLEKEDGVSAIKTHFLTRMCGNVDQIDTQDRYEDSYYCDFLLGTEIDAFQELVPLAKLVLKYSGGHLWMAGVDYFEKNEAKYKIYIKKRGLEIYSALLQAVRETQIPNAAQIAEGLERLECWHDRHPELCSDGIAISLDSKGCWAFNFYDLWR